jgi:hypothetical protein
VDDVMPGFGGGGSLGGGRYAEDLHEPALRSLVQLRASRQQTEALEPRVRARLRMGLRQCHEESDRAQIRARLASRRGLD